MRKLALGLLLTMLIPGTALAQSEPAADQGDDEEEVVDQTDRPIEPVPIVTKKKKARDDEEAGDGGEKGEGKPVEEPEDAGEWDPNDTSHGRFRGGVSGNIGAFLPPPIFQIGAAGRLGYQINDLFAVYGGFGAQAGFGIGVGVSDDSASASVSFGGGVFGEAIFEVTLADVFFIGTGPALFYGAFVSAEQAVGSSGNTASAEQSVSSFSGVMPGLKIRTGVGFGKNRPDRRKQFTLAADLMILFGEKLSAGQSAGTGGASAYVSDGVAVGFLPMLSLGFDAK
jgi:hypothetical protein